MRRTISFVPTTMLAVLFVIAIGIAASAQTETVLHSFKTTEGVSPVMGLIFDSAGNLYGVAEEGGGSNNGTVFKLSPTAGNNWTEKTIFSFNGSNGSMPLASLVIDSGGNLYGTTKLGGAKGVGVAFELMPAASGPWTEKILHTFGSGGDGAYPAGNLILDNDGNLYGTTQGGGAHGNGQENVGGAAFKLAFKSGAWTETVLYSFGANSTDGVSPRANLVRDTAGDLYGTTTRGGANHVGTVFKLAPQSNGTFTKTIIHSFNSDFNTGDGFIPAAGLILDSTGNLYGTTTFGGSGGGGTVFELSPIGNSWTETILDNFQFSFLRPKNPYSTLVFDTAGNLYGSTIFGGIGGVVFELKPSGTGKWTETDLYVFDSTHGAEPGIGALVLDSSGNVYGAAQAGGANKNGVVFKITP